MPSEIAASETGFTLAARKPRLLSHIRQGVAKRPPGSASLQRHGPMHTVTTMIIRTLEEVVGTERDVAWGNGQSRRFLLERDGMGYSLTDTLVLAGTESLLEYKHHLETCYCIAGEGEVEDMQGRVFPIKVGTMYALDANDKHWLRAKTDLRLVCVFRPALSGAEAHKLRPDGSSHY